MLPSTPMCNTVLSCLAALLGSFACGESWSSSPDEVTNDSLDKHSDPPKKSAIEVVTKDLQVKVEEACRCTDLTCYQVALDSVQWGTVYDTLRLSNPLLKRLGQCEAALKSEAATLNPDATVPSSREEQALWEIEKIEEAYAYFYMATGKECPAALTELDKYRSNKTAKDPWGNDLVIICGPGAPNGFRILSIGPDGVRGSSDDITTW